MVHFLSRFSLATAICALLAGCTVSTLENSTANNEPTPALATPEATPEASSIEVAAVELLGVITVPNDTMAFETLVGGLSAISYAGEGNGYYFLSDDRAITGPSRIYQATVDTGDGTLSEGDLVWTGLIPLQDESGKFLARGAIDPEGLVFQADRFYVATEGEAKAQPPIAPAILHFTQSGEYVQSLLLPDSYLPLADGSRGVRENQGLESLTLTPDGRFLISGVENALQQDGPAATLEETSAARLLTFDLIEQSVVREALYIVEPIPVAPDPSTGEADNGLVDLVALDNGGTLLAVERSYAEGIGNTVRLYLAHTQEATDVSGMQALSESEPITPVEKELVVDFGELGAEVGVAPDNLEGLALGPQLDDGRRLLLVVSDNNFNPSQTTQLWALALTFVD
jgi:hypothetical protein